MRDEDHFLVLKPDVFIDAAVVMALLSYIAKREYPIFAINIYNNHEVILYDKEIRRFPAVSSFAVSFLWQKNNALYDKSQITQDTEIEWAAGSSLLFRAKRFRELGSFDTQYHMYCEDLDICWRARRELGIKVVYLPQFKALHLAQMRSRSFFSRHFIWHVTSALRFCLKQALNK